MTKKVLKFGGTSVGSIERIIHAAKIVKKEYENGNSIIVVVSAMSGKTNELLKLSHSVSKNFSKRELDVLLSTGEQATSALLAGALNELGVKAKSWMNWQIPILTEGDQNNSRIINISVDKIEKYLLEKGVAIIPGYQGISSLGEITTIGRGGSDATAVAVAKIFNTESCEIYTDVDGVYSTDPNKIPVAKRIDKISYEEMLELSSLGAKVMQSSAVQTAMMYDIPLQVRSTFTERKGTKIFTEDNLELKLITPKMENVIYSVSHHEGKFIIITNKDNCRNFKIMETDVSKPSVENWKEFIPYNEDIYIKGVDELQNHLVVLYKYNGTNKVRVIKRINGKYDFENMYDISLGGKNMSDDDEVRNISLFSLDIYNTDTIWISHDSLDTPLTLYEFNLDTRNIEVLREKLIPNFDKIIINKNSSIILFNLICFNVFANYFYAICFRSN